MHLPPQQMTVRRAPGVSPRPVVQKTFCNYIKIIHLIPLLVTEKKKTRYLRGATSQRPINLILYFSL